MHTPTIEQVSLYRLGSDTPIMPMWQVSDEHGRYVIVARREDAELLFGQALERAAKISN